MAPLNVRLGVAVIGVGTVGGALVDELLANGHFAGCGIVPLVICNSRKELCHPTTDWRNQLGQGEDWSADAIDGLLDRIRGGAPQHLVVIDCTANERIGQLYPKLLRANISVVTANKKGLAGPMNLIASLQIKPNMDIVPSMDIGPSMDEALPRLGFESTVGAGLPIIRAIQSIQAAGDSIERVEGILSGTLAYLFNCFMPADGSPGQDFLQALEEARAKGYTEPDPLEDLRGMDVARKACILSRLLGNPVGSPDDIVKSLFDREDGEDFDRLNGRLAKLRQGCTSKGEFLRYIVRLSPRSAEIGLTALPASSPLLSSRGCDNIATITTTRFPAGITIQGAGAGPSATIHGILADIADIYSRLPSP